MSKSRGNGEGSILKKKTCENCRKRVSAISEEKLKVCRHCGAKLPKEGVWIAQCSIGLNPATEKYTRKTFTGKTRTEVVEKMDQILHQHRTGTYIEPSQVTLQQWVKDWLKGRRPHLAENTWNTYDTIARQHIIPVLGQLKLKDLRTREIQSFLTDKLENGRVDGKGGLSSNTIAKIHQTLSGALGQAVKERMISHNPCEHCELPKKETKEMRPLSAEEAGKFLIAAQNSPHYTAFYLMLSTGMRRGETLGLRWKDIDLENGIISIKQQLTKSKNGQRLMLGAPKTRNSIRTIKLHKDILAELKKYKSHWNQVRMKAILKNHYDAYDLVFCNEEGGPQDPDNLGRRYKTVAKAIGIENTSIHDIRHYVEC